MPFILQAAKDFHIDLEKSWMVGDSEHDMEAGRAAGCKTAFIGNAAGENSFSDLQSFVESVLL